METKNDLPNVAKEKEFSITRVFNAPLDLVWKVQTEAEHLAKWWGPKGLKMISVNLDLRPGGMFHYGMETPDGHQMWGRFVYREVQPKTRLSFVVSFSDEKGGITKHPMSDTWPLEVLSTITLTEQEGKTTLTISGRPINATEAEINTYHASYESMQQGFNGTFSQLEEYLAELTK